MIIYVFNNFSTIEGVARVFNIIYGFYFTLIIYIIVNTVAAIKLNSFEKEKSNVKNEMINVGLKIINFFIVIFGLLIVLYFAGVNLTAVLSGLGIGGFAVAFAAKDTISNFFGTLSVLFSDVFSQGDWIEVDGKEGVVVEIGLRVTTLRTFDNALIAIPNGTFANKDIKNWNKRKLGRRIKMKLGVKYDSKQEDIKNAIAEIKEMLQKHPQIATKETKYEYKTEYGHMAKLVSKDDLEGIKKSLFVYLDEFGGSSINILIYCFSKSVDWEDWLQTKQDVMEKIMIIFEKNSLEFAFPSLSIYNETKVLEK
jgi:MscS family membrane protein